MVSGEEKINLKRQRDGEHEKGQRKPLKKIDICLTSPVRYICTKTRTKKKDKNITKKKS